MLQHHGSARAPKTIAILLAPLYAYAGASAAEPAQLQTVVVTATRSEIPLRDLANDVTVVSRSDIERAGLQSLSDVLARSPGVQVVDAGGRGSTATLMIRGTSTNQSVILIDGQRVSSATTGTTAIEHIPLEQIEHIEIVRGPMSSLYGADAIGGVINITTKRTKGTPRASAFVGYGSYNTTIGSLGYGGDFGKTRFDVSLGTEYSSGFNALRAPTTSSFDAFNPDRDGYRNQNLNASLSHQLTDALSLGASTFQVHTTRHYDSANCDTSFFVCTSQFDNQQRQSLAGNQVFVRFAPNEMWNSTLRSGRSKDSTWSNRLDPAVSQVFEDRFTTYQYQTSLLNELNTSWGQFLLGLERRREAVEATQNFTTNERITRSVMLGYHLNTGPHTIQLSGRRDSISQFPSQNTGSVAYAFRFAENWKARVGAGTAFHAPSFNDLYFPFDPTLFFEGNPSLKPEKSRSREAGIAYETERARASLTLYRNHVTDLIDFVTDASSISRPENVNRAVLRGATFEAGASFGAFRLKGNFDALSARNEDTDRSLQRRAPRSGAIELRYGLNDWDFGSRVYASSYRYNNPSNSVKLAGYGLLDLDATYKLEKSLSAIVQVRNVLDREYVVLRDFNLAAYSTPGRTLFVGLRYVPN